MLMMNYSNITTKIAFIFEKIMVINVSYHFQTLFNLSRNLCPCVAIRLKIYTQTSFIYFFTAFIIDKKQLYTLLHLFKVIS